MVKTTKLAKDDDGIYRIEIPEECVSERGWRDGHVLKADTEDKKIIIEKLSGFVCT